MSQGKCILDRENTLKKEVEPRNTQFVGLHVRMKWKTKLEGEKENVRVNHVSSPRIPAQGFKLFRPVGQPTPVFLPGESQGRGSLVGCHLWGRTELDTTEVT